MNNYIFSAKLWVNDIPGGWYLVTIPEDISSEIEDFYASKKGFKSLSVKVTIGNTSWRTSIFYDKDIKAYLLPLKGEVRKKEKLSIGDTIDIGMEI